MSRLNIYSKEQIDANVGTSEDAASASGTLWARLKNAVSRIVGLESADTQNVKLTGNQTIAGTKTLQESPIVPTTPSTPTGAVNSVYVNDATEGVNNIVHKDASSVQIINGELATRGNLVIRTPYGPTEAPSSTTNRGFYITDKDSSTQFTRLIDRRYASKGSDFWIDHLAIRDNAGTDETYNAISIRFMCPYNDAQSNRAILTGQRAFNATNTTDIVTIGTLIEALRSYNLIQ